MTQTHSAQARPLTDDPNLATLLLVMQDRHVGGSRTNQGVYSREVMNRRRGPMTPEAWATWEMVNPNPKHGFGYQFHPDLTAPVMPSVVHVADFDESKTFHRTLPQILESLPVEPLCAVPTRTPGNYQVWWALDTPTWQPLRECYTGDPAFSPRTLAHNPIHRSLYPTKSGERTWWNPEIAYGAIPMHDPKEFTGKPRADRPAVEREQIVTGSRMTLDELLTAMSQAQVGQRHPLLHLYITKVSCIEHKRTKVDLTRADYQRIADEGNQKFPKLKPADEVTGLVEYHNRERVYAKQSARALKRHGLDHDPESEVERFGTIAAYAQHYEIRYGTARKRVHDARAKRA